MKANPHNTPCINLTEQLDNPALAAQLHLKQYNTMALDTIQLHAFDTVQLHVIQYNSI